MLDRHAFRSPTEARLAVFDFIESFYNPRRRHSAIGNVSPMRFESIHAARSLDDELGRAPRFRETAGLMEPLRGSTPTAHPLV